MDFHSQLQLVGPDGGERATSTSGSTTRRCSTGSVSSSTVRVGRDDPGAGGRPQLFDGPVVLGQDTPPGGNPLAQPWVGVIKLPTLRPQQALVLELYPDAEAISERSKPVCRNR